MVRKGLHLLGPDEVFSSLSRLVMGSSKKVGKAPGTVEYIGRARTDPVRIDVIDYNTSAVETNENISVADILTYARKKSVSWVNVTGVHDASKIKDIGELFSLHPLVLEDITNTHQRPKIEAFDSHVFIVLKMIYYNEERKSIQREQVSLVMGEGFVLSFQEREGDIFADVRKRIFEGRKKIRSLQSDYLVYALIDAVVDHYFLTLESFGEHVESLEQEVIHKPFPSTLASLYSLKRELIFLRKAVWPIRDMLSTALRGEYPLFSEETLMYLRDVQDHVIRAIDTVETFRDVLSGLVDLYMSTMSNRMNEVMKTLTVIATIFIPLTFIVGIYGMNFTYMPELAYRWGYFLVWIVMGIVAFCMILYFRWKRWF